MGADESVQSPEDWPDFAAVVDPMVLRSADVLLTGPTGQAAVDVERWRALSQNWTAVLAFFDLLVFESQIPMIDYDLTFDPPGDFQVAVLYDIVNGLHRQLDDRTPQPLVAVTVEGEAAWQARSTALEALARHGPVEVELRDSIAVELSAFDHQWRPPLTEIDEHFVGDFDSVDRQVTTFIYGGLLFGAFADQAAAAHCLHSKRRRLDLAVALDARSASFDADAELRAQLDRMLEHALGPHELWVEGLAAIPPVLPYLLTRYEPASFHELVLRALELRRTDLVKSFRHWKKEMLDSMKRSGLPPPDVERQMQEIAVGMRNHLEPAAKGWKTVFRYVPVPDAWQKRLWSWSLRSAPGRRHLKLLFDLQIADRRYTYAGRIKTLARTLHRLWSTPESARPAPSPS